MVKGVAALHQFHDFAPRTTGPTSPSNRQPSSRSSVSRIDRPWLMRFPTWRRSSRPVYLPSDPLRVPMFSAPFIFGGSPTRRVLLEAANQPLRAFRARRVIGVQPREPIRPWAVQLGVLKGKSDPVSRDANWCAISNSTGVQPLREVPINFAFNLHILEVPFSSACHSRKRIYDVFRCGEPRPIAPLSFAHSRH